MNIRSGPNSIFKYCLVFSFNRWCWRENSGGGGVMWVDNKQRSAVVHHKIVKIQFRKICSEGKMVCKVQEVPF